MHMCTVSMFVTLHRQTDTHTHTPTGATTSWISAVLISDIIVLCLLFGLLSFTFLRAGRNSLMHTQIHRYIHITHAYTHTHTQEEKTHSRTK